MTHPTPAPSSTPPTNGDGVVPVFEQTRRALTRMPAASVDCVTTTPPHPRVENSHVSAVPEDHVDGLRDVFRELWRMLRPAGTLWLHLPDPADGDLSGWPWRVVFGLQGDGWILRSAIVWHHPNAMLDRTSGGLARRHELVFLLVRSRHYFFDLDAIRVASASTRPASRRARTGPGRKPNSVHTPWRPSPGSAGVNPGDVWTIPTTSDRHAGMPVALARRCVAAGSPTGGVVLDPFHATGPTALAAHALGRRFLGIHHDNTPRGGIT